MKTQPNILVFLTDDHAQWASHCYGNSELCTPNMDRLADTGVRMTNAYTPSPVCSPGRACFFTGRLPSQHGIHDWLQEWDVGADHPGLDGETTIAQLLQGRGYQTALIGKWHCARSWLPQPGFERWFSHQRGYQYPHCGEQKFSDQGQAITMYGYQSPLLTDQAMGFLRQRDTTRPFFLFIGYVDTHTPYEGHPRRLVDAYRQCTFCDIPSEQINISQGWARFPWPDSPDQCREWLAQYYAAVTMIDEQIGRVLDELEAANQLDNTLVVYTSDHGHMNGHHGLNTKGNATIPQNFYDESIRVPCLLSWQEGLPAGMVYDAPVDHCDLFWTLLDAAGAETDEKTRKEINSPGKSYWPLLTDSTSMTWRDVQFCEYGNARMIRTNTAKLIRRYKGPNGSFGDEFYNLARDPRECDNRIDDPAAQMAIEELSTSLNEHFAKYEIDNRSGRFIADQPVCNNYEPWRLSTPRPETPP